MSNVNLLDGETALVTGSGRGLGRAIADRLAELGAAVAIHDIHPEACAEFGEAPDLDAVRSAIARHGTPTLAVCGDIADEAQVADLVGRAESAMGPLSILVNCAGGDIAAQGGKPKPNNALGIPMQDVRAILDRNLIGTMFVCRMAMTGMIQRRRGSVVNIASIAAHFGIADGVAYAVAKAGIIQFTRCLATEMRPLGIRVNAVSPGPTMTARFLATRPIDPRQADDSVALARYAKPHEIADAVAFLAGPMARHITGQILAVDGGRTAMPPNL